MENQEITPEKNEDKNNDNELRKIFQISKSDNSKFIPFLLKNGKEEIKKIFSGDPNIINHKHLKQYISEKIKLINQIIEIIGNSYEIICIIFDYLSQQNISPFIFFIDLYMNYITNNNEKSPDNNKLIIIKEIKNIFSYFISCGLLYYKNNRLYFSKNFFFPTREKIKY